MSTLSDDLDDHLADQWLPPRTPLQHFRLRWDRNAQSFTATKRLWSDSERPITDKLRSFTTWQRTRHNGNVEDVGARFRDLYYSKLDIDNEREWNFVHFLGRGGFGAVALFERFEGDDGDRTDEVVVKTTMANVRDAVSPRNVGMTKEAAYMCQTNELSTDGMLKLRNFKFYNLDNQYRYYFEYCPYGDLERLRIRYKAYGRYFPELFLWHLFYWLSKTMLEYTSKNRWRNINPSRWGQFVRGGYLLHCDIKPQNIFLGPPDPDETDVDVALYPIPRVADLGLAEVTNLSTATNEAWRFHKGTRPYFPPEVRFDQLNRGSEFYPFGDRVNSDRDDRYRKAHHKVGSGANVWAVGAVMYQMMTLQDHDKLENIVNNILSENWDMPDPGDPTVGDADFNLLPGQNYSFDLRQLIDKCISIKPDERIDEQQLHRRAKAGYLYYLNRFKSDVADHAPDGEDHNIFDAVDRMRNYKVYYHGNEIDHADDNDRFAHVGRDPHWWTNFFAADFPWLIPEWGRLWPDQMPEDILAPSNWPTNWQRAFHAEQRRRRDARLRGTGASLTQAQQVGQDADAVRGATVPAAVVAAVPAAVPAVPAPARALPPPPRSPIVIPEDIVGELRRIINQDARQRLVQNQVQQALQQARQAAAQRQPPDQPPPIQPAGRPSDVAAGLQRLGFAARQANDRNDAEPAAPGLQGQIQVAGDHGNDDGDGAGNANGDNGDGANAAGDNKVDDDDAMDVDEGNVTGPVRRGRQMRRASPYNLLNRSRPDA